MYLPGEEQEHLDPAQHDHTWDVLPESEGNSWETLFSGHVQLMPQGHGGLQGHSC